MLKKVRNLRKDTATLLWISISLFMALSLYSYSNNDPSWNSLGSHFRPVNWCGYLGSFTSDFLYQFFGMSSWVFVLFSVFMGFKILKQKNEKIQGYKQVWILVLLITSAALNELYLSDWRYYNGTVGVGGIIGSFFATTLNKGLNFYGAALFLWTLFFVSFLTLTDWTISGISSTAVEGFSYLIETFKRIFLTLSKQFLGLFSKPPKESHETSALFCDNQDPFIESDNEPDLEFEEEDNENDNEPPPNKRRRVSLNKKVQRKIANWKLPELKMLEDPPASRYRVDEKEVKNKSKLLLNKLMQFSVKGEVKGAKPGPAVTMFEFKPNDDVKISKITELADDLSLALSSESVRIIAPIPGRDVVGIETSNSNRETVYLKDIVANDDFWSEEIQLPLALGREANGTPKVVDLRRMPHLLVAGTTGSGKSVFVVCALTGLLFRHSPKTLRLILIDPKQVDLSTFNDIPHLLMPTICEPKKAVIALKWAVKEMEKRYRSMSKFGARGLEAYNETVEEFSKEKIAEHEAYNQELMDQRRGNESYYFTPQPYIVIVVEEFGDLMAVDKNNVEQLVVRLAQMARASGLHLILAMQSPRKDVVTGLIKTNIPGRISFKVASKMDSRIILDESGGERLLARGDMLFLAPGVAKPIRHHGPWVTESEISSVMEYWSEQAEPEYDFSAMNLLNNTKSAFGDNLMESLEDEEYDDRYDEVLSWVSVNKSVSASLIQRKFRIGYPRAARLIETMEREGVIGPANGSKPRAVLVNSYQGKES